MYIDAPYIHMLICLLDMVKKNRFGFTSTAESNRNIKTNTYWLGSMSTTNNIYLIVSSHICKAIHAQLNPFSGSGSI